MIEATAGFRTASTTLQDRLLKLDTPEGLLQTLKDRLTDGQQDLRRAGPSERKRIEDDIGWLKKQVVHQERVIGNPKNMASKAEVKIKKELRAIRHPKKIKAKHRQWCSRRPQARFLDTFRGSRQGPNKLEIFCKIAIKVC